jgi:hypothetical protein
MHSQIFQRRSDCKSGSTRCHPLVLSKSIFQTRTTQPSKTIMGGISRGNESGNHHQSLDHLLDVVDEARHVLLKFYEKVSISNEVELNSSISYVDFGRDTILLRRLAIDCLVEMASECNASIRKFPAPGWVSQVQNLAVITQGYRSFAPDWPVSPFLGLSAVSNQSKSQERDIEFLISVFETFPRLKLLFLVIDGRKPGVDANGSVAISEPTDEHEDYYEENGRNKAL